MKFEEYIVELKQVSASQKRDCAFHDVGLSITV
jgi:hypothetical protein